jgi:hypothetical protein
MVTGRSRNGNGMVTVTGQNQNFYCNREREKMVRTYAHFVIYIFKYIRITKSKEHNMKFFIAIFLNYEQKMKTPHLVFLKMVKNVWTPT